METIRKDMKLLKLLEIRPLPFEARLYPGWPWSGMLLLGDRLRQSLSKQGIPVAPGNQAPTDPSPTSTDARSPETTEAREAGGSFAPD